MKKVVVIGAGPAGYVCAIRLAQYGLDVTVVEKEELGGTCLNVGCIPSKALIAAGALMDRVAKASAMGITGELSLDVHKLVEWKQGIVGRLTGGVASLLEKNGAKVVRGNASFRDPRTLVVQGGDGQQELKADEFVIATGSAPISIPGFALDGEDVWSSTEALSPEGIPGHLLVIGGGYIGLELGMLYRKLGSQVTVVEFTEGALPGQDRDCVKVIERSIKKQKIRFLTKTAAKGWEKSGDKYLVRVESADGAGDTVECDRVLCTVGRRPYTDGLGLESIGLATDERGFLPVDQHLRTRLPHVYAIGDVAGQPMLAHKGSKEGLVVAGVIAGKNEVVDYRCVPAVIFTAPEMASVGLLEDDAREKGHEVAVGQFRFAASGRAMSLMETEGFVKVVADAKTDEVLGVHMVGPEVTELIAEAALAIELGATTEDIARTIHAHPTLPEVLMEAAEDVHGMAVHIYNPKR
jgi:dihydrolipoamide dehydrogenase